MNVNKIIHEAMGLCWHDFISSNKLGCPFECSKCGETKLKRNKPDYTDPVHYCELMDWMRGNEQWRIFGNWLMRTHGDSQFRFLMKKEQEQITLIAEAIEGGVFL